MVQQTQKLKLKVRSEIVLTLNRIYKTISWPKIEKEEPVTHQIGLVMLTWLLLHSILHKRMKEMSLEVMRKLIITSNLKIGLLV